jgi:hypothetical protein
VVPAVAASAVPIGDGRYEVARGIHPVCDGTAGAGDGGCGGADGGGGTCVDGTDSLDRDATGALWLPRECWSPWMAIPSPTPAPIASAIDNKYPFVTTSKM